MKISLCMIVKNEEEVLARCLDSVKDLVDEMIIVDTGSTDATKSIAQKFTPNVYDFIWTNDFSSARNFSFAKGTGDYLLWLDADDILFESERQAFLDARKLLETEQPDALFCKYQTGFYEGKPSLTFERERFLRKNCNFLWKGRVHECISPRGKICHSPLIISHLGSDKDKTWRNLRIYEAWAKEELLSPRDVFYYGRELYYHKLYSQAIALLREVVEGEGWRVNQIEACKILGECYKAQGKTDEAKKALLQSFLFGEPRAGILCALASLLFEEKRYFESIFWYERALESKNFAQEGDFEDEFAHTLTPLLGLVCCYYALGNKEIAQKYHKKTEELFPYHPSVLYNKQFFE